ncbi:hypothetical protein [Treponema sp. UBA3813]|uniref:hypothetical protein n=1 Tax=Treponema sp. UBA3813 TaxID=1947715 RepID=UPI0025F38706|nr:hypothetical protein [Treponema sp. UBA3813]
MRKIITVSSDDVESRTSALKILSSLFSETSEFEEIWRDWGTDSWGWFKINGITIFVSTTGSDAASFKKNIEYIQKYDCSIGVMAAPKSAAAATDEIEIEHFDMDKYKKSIKNSAKDSTEAKNRIVASALFTKICCDYGVIPVV